MEMRSSAGAHTLQGSGTTSTKTLLALTPLGTFSKTVVKMVTLVTWVLLALLASVGAISGRGRGSEVVCATGFVAIAGGCYSFHQEIRRWEIAEQECWALDAELVSVLSYQQYIGLLEHLNTNYAGAYWTSGVTASRGWIWAATGYPMAQEWWGRTPSTAPYQCAYFCSNTLKYWAITCDASLRYICEKPPEVPRDEEYGTGEAPGYRHQFPQDNPASSYKVVSDEYDIVPPHVPAEVPDTSSVGAATPLSATSMYLLIMTLLLLL